MEKSKLKKAQRTQAEFDKLKEAAANAKLNNSIGQSLKQQQLYGSNIISGTAGMQSLRPNNQPA
jgi:hypothetical protein